MISFVEIFYSFQTYTIMSEAQMFKSRINKKKFSYIDEAFVFDLASIHA